jgi:hypothetical protein
MTVSMSVTFFHQSVLLELETESDLTLSGMFTPATEQFPTTERKPREA